MHCTGRSATAGSEAQHAKALTVGNLLRDWNIQATGIDVCDESTLELALVSKGCGEAAE